MHSKLSLLHSFLQEVLFSIQSFRSSPSLTSLPTLLPSPSSFPTSFSPSLTPSAYFPSSSPLPSSSSLLPSSLPPTSSSLLLPPTTLLSSQKPALIVVEFKEVLKGKSPLLVEQWIFDLGLVQIPKEKGIVINEDKIFQKKLIILKKTILNLLVALPLHKKKKEEEGGGKEGEKRKERELGKIRKEQFDFDKRIEEGLGIEEDGKFESNQLVGVPRKEKKRESEERGVGKSIKDIQGKGVTQPQPGIIEGGGQASEVGTERGGERVGRISLRNLKVNLVMKPSEVSSFQGFTTQERVQLYKRFPNESEIALYFDSEYPNRTFKFTFQVNYLEISDYCKPKVNRFRSLSEKLVGGGEHEEEKSAPWVGGGVREEEEEEGEKEEGGEERERTKREEEVKEEKGSQKEEVKNEKINLQLEKEKENEEERRSKSLVIPDKDLMIVNKSPLTGIINGHGKMKEMDNISMEFESEAAFYSTIERSNEFSTKKIIEAEPECSNDRSNRKKEEEKELIIANLLEIMEGEFSKLNLRIKTKVDPDSITRHLDRLALFSNKMI